MNGELKLTTMVEMEEERRPMDEEGLFPQLLARPQELQNERKCAIAQRQPSREQRAQAAAQWQLSGRLPESIELKRLHLMHRLLPTTQEKALTMTRGRSIERGSSGSQNHDRSKSQKKNSKASISQGCVASTSKDGDILLSEAVVNSNGERQLHDRWIIDLGATWHMTSNRDWFYIPMNLSQVDLYSLEMIHVEDRIIKVVRGNLVVMKAEKIKENSYVLMGDTLQEANATIALTSQEEVMLMWHRRLRHMLERGESPGLSLGGEEYFLSIDDYSRRLWTIIMVGLMVMEEFEDTKLLLEVDLSTFDLDTILLPLGETCGIVSDDEEVYQEDNLEFECGFGNIIIVDHLHVVPMSFREGEVLKTQE
ncbi:hypothetical protein V8G54_030843 [Vigna mungo]|uniref:Uncharacterized protein n=1 Tax=Vigna mungo TaxID=3915 RepID=A0AAQ3MX79_VIGMU